MGQRKKATKSELVARNKAAFDEVIGDPYAYPEPLSGHYYLLKQRSSITAAPTPDKMQAKGPANRARPSSVDFFCDVEAAIRDGLESYFKNIPLECEFSPLDGFIATYITEDDRVVIYSQNERAGIEQAIGRLLVARKISPVTKYFTTVKQ